MRYLKVGFDRYDNKHYRSECRLAMEAIVANGGIIDEYKDDYVVYHTLSKRAEREVLTQLYEMIKQDLIDPS